MALRILLVDDEPLNLDLLEQELDDLGYVTDRAADGPGALHRLETWAPDVLLLDYQMPGMNGIEVLTEIRKKGRDLPVIMITAHGSVERAVEAMKAGADDFITKPFDAEHLALVLKKATERIRARLSLEVLSEEASGRYRLVIGASELMKQTAEDARKAAHSRATVLLLGESGTGKEIFARAIHQWSDRKSEQFVAINCAGLSRDLLETELFGHERGAFTGAHQQKKGKLEMANGGTLFLDEVGDISPELQTKLLRFLQEREFERVGGTQAIAVDVRVIAATNKDLEQAVRQGAFRDDLYHRLNVVAITLPPLRDRKDDIPVLAEFFLRRFSAETKKGFVDIAVETLDKLRGYSWPGNVRELANVIERAVVLGEGPVLTAQQLPARVGGSQPQAAKLPVSYHSAVNAYRRELVVTALASAQGNRVVAAKALGLHRTHLLKLMKALQIE
jgi:DNA-binding NtrC family response regulator